MWCPLIAQKCHWLKMFTKETDWRACMCLTRYFLIRDSRIDRTNRLVICVRDFGYH